MEAGNCPCIKLVKVLLKKLQNDLFKVLYVPWITAYKLMKKTALDFFKGFFGMTTSGRTDYELIVQELLC